LLLQQFTGWNISTSILVLGGVTIVYTYLGGMEAVIWTDLVQFVIYICGAIIAAAYIIHLLPGGWDAYVQTTSNAGRFRLIDLDTNILKAQTLWAGVLGGAFVTMASHGADQNMVQRYLCARSLGQARTALVLSGFVVALQFTLFLGIGLGLSALVGAGQMAIPPGTHTDAVFGIFIVRYLPTGLIGLVVAAVLASAMASFSSSLNSAANAVVADFYRPLRPHHTEATYLRIAKAMTSVVGFAKVAVALACIPVMMSGGDYAGYRSVVDQVLAVASVTLGLILGLFGLGLLPGRVSSESALCGMVFGFFAAGGLWLSSILGRPVVAWPWLAPIGTLTTVLIAVIVNKFLRQPNVTRPTHD
jgi:Na+/proline symporter